MVIWRGTLSFTVGRNCTSAHSATFHARRLPTSKDISASTLKKNSTIAINAAFLAPYLLTPKRTSRGTLVKKHTRAHRAIIRAIELVTWNFTWWESTQERNHSNVTSAATPVLLRILCKATRGNTLGKDHSSATTAAKLTKTRYLWRSTSKCICPDSNLHCKVNSFSSRY